MADEPLTVATWTFDHVPGDPERIATALSEADLAVLRGLGQTTSDKFLSKVTASLDARTHSRHCRGHRGNQALVWREDRVIAVRPDGAMIEACAARGYDLNAPGGAVFAARAEHHLFTIGDTFERWPGLVYDQAVPRATKLGFKRVSKETPASTWTRGLYLVEARPATLTELYPDLNARDLERKVGRFAPTTLRLSFTEPSVETLEMVKRTTPARRRIASEPVYESYPSTVDSNNLSVPEDDLEAEERASRPKSLVNAKKSRQRR